MWALGMPLGTVIVYWSLFVKSIVVLVSSLTVYTVRCGTEGAPPRPVSRRRRPPCTTWVLPVACS